MSDDWILATTALAVLNLTAAASLIRLMKARGTTATSGTRHRRADEHEATERKIAYTATTADAPIYPSSSTEAVLAGLRDARQLVTSAPHASVRIAAGDNEVLFGVAGELECLVTMARGSEHAFLLGYFGTVPALATGAVSIAGEERAVREALRFLPVLSDAYAKAAGAGTEATGAFAHLARLEDGATGVCGDDPIDQYDTGAQLQLGAALLAEFPALTRLAEVGSLLAATRTTRRDPRALRIAALLALCARDAPNATCGRPVRKWNRTRRKLG